MSFFFMLHSLSITFQFHCLEKKALIHHHMQFTTLMFGWTLFSPSQNVRAPTAAGSTVFESNLLTIATSSVISQKRGDSTSAPESILCVRATVLSPSPFSVDLVAVLQFFSLSQLLVYTIDQHFSSVSLYRAR